MNSRKIRWKGCFAGMGIFVGTCDETVWDLWIINLSCDCDTSTEICRKEGKCENENKLAQDRKQWRAVVNMAMNFRVV